MVTGRWKTRDLEIFEFFGVKVRVASLEQLIRVWWTDSPNPQRAATRRVRTLEAAGFIHAQHLDIPKMLALNGPLLRWKPGAPAPNAEEVSNQLIARWPKDMGYQSSLVCWPSKWLANLFASYSAKPPILEQLPHDLHVTETYLWFLANRPTDARNWRGEDQFQKAGFRQKDPDAWIVSGIERKQVIEFGGKYPPHRIQDFHDYCYLKRYPYEIW